MSTKIPNIVLLGDSIRMDYQEIVIESLGRQANVWAPEENCEDSAFIIKNIKKWFSDRRPDLIYMNCGLHDIVLDEKLQCRRSVQDYGKNLETILSWLMENCKGAKVIFALTTPVIEERQKISQTYKRLVRRNSDVDQYNEEMVRIAENQNVLVDDIHRVLKNETLGNMLIEDGIHLSSCGARLLGKHIADKIEKLMTCQLNHTGTFV
ncbi:MAG: hypothetical protein JKX85_13165 [Phycisphaeraceae bacterium]|nr:hypothetical protein [Phycisphaeraceae bacterium]